MKKIIFIILLFLGIVYLWHFLFDTETKQENKTTAVADTTKLCVKNASDTSITVFLTLGAPDTNWIGSVQNIFGITTNGLQGSFVLAAGDSVLYTPTKPIQGNVSFGAAPVNCPNGVTVYEFCLNNNTTISAAQETIEISCVAGVSSIGSINLSGNVWNAGPTYTNVTFVKNDTAGTNTNLVGVYPVGCTNCINTEGAPTCVTPEKADSLNICNVQRPANTSGGMVKINFIRLVK